MMNGVLNSCNAGLLAVIGVWGDWETPRLVRNECAMLEDIETRIEICY